MVRLPTGRNCAPRRHARTTGAPRPICWGCRCWPTIWRRGFRNSDGLVRSSKRGDCETMPFRNRADAGQKLAAELAAYRHEQVTILALPRGGAMVAAEIAGALAAPLDLILVRKVGVPFQPELAMGAVVDGTEPIIVRNHDVIAITGISEEEFDSVCQR